jgi:8-oxo-dGTP diphosphatase
MFADVTRVKYKVMAYITHHHHLLVFRHLGAPEAGIQVPAGKVEEQEQAEDAVLREAYEETGLTHLTLNCFLGEQERDLSDFSRGEVHLPRAVPPLIADHGIMLPQLLNILRRS